MSGAGTRLRPCASGCAASWSCERDGHELADRALGSRKGRLLLQLLAAQRGRPGGDGAHRRRPVGGRAAARRGRERRHPREPAARGAGRRRDRGFPRRVRPAARWRLGHRRRRGATAGRRGDRPAHEPASPGSPGAAATTGPRPAGGARRARRAAPTTTGSRHCARRSAGCGAPPGISRRVSAIQHRRPRDRPGAGRGGRRGRPVRRAGLPRPDDRARRRRARVLRRWRSTPTCSAPCVASSASTRTATPARCIWRSCAATSPRRADHAATPASGPARGQAARPRGRGRRGQGRLVVGGGGGALPDAGDGRGGHRQVPTARRGGVLGTGDRRARACRPLPRFGAVVVPAAGRRGAAPRADGMGPAALADLAGPHADALVALLPQLSRAIAGGSARAVSSARAGGRAAAGVRGDRTRPTRLSAIGPFCSCSTMRRTPGWRPSTCSTTCPGTSGAARVLLSRRRAARRVAPLLERTGERRRVVTSGCCRSRRSPRWPRRPATRIRRRRLRLGPRAIRSASWRCSGRSRRGSRASPTSLAEAVLRASRGPDPTREGAMQAAAVLGGQIDPATARGAAGRVRARSRTPL